MVQTYQNANKNRIGIFSASLVVAIIGYYQFKAVGNIAFVNVILGAGLAFLEFIDILILHFKRFRDVIKKIPIIRFMKKYEIRVAEDYLLCKKGRIKIVETNKFPEKPMLFLVPDGKGNMIYGKFLICEAENKIFVLTDCKIKNDIDKERALLKII